LQRNNTLTILNLQDNNLGDNGAVAIGTAIRNNKNCALVTLNLRLNRIGDKGAIALRNAIQKNSTLQDLKLFLNDIDPALRDDIDALLRRNR